MKEHHLVHAQRQDLQQSQSPIHATQRACDKNYGNFRFIMSIGTEIAQQSLALLLAFCGDDAASFGMRDVLTD
jgi:hypothetical protein